MGPLAIIPARAGSKGIPNKNFTPLAGRWPVDRAIEVADRAGCSPIIVSTDADFSVVALRSPSIVLRRPAALAQDDTPMIDVVRHVLEQMPGPDDQAILLLQPTQPLRQPKHLTAALELLTPDVDSVVSVVEVPAAYRPELLCEINHGATLHVYNGCCECLSHGPLDAVPCRQDARPAYRRDGTVYAFWRSTAKSSLYGQHCVPLIIPATESVSLDTPDDWLEAERRLRALS